MMTGQPVRSSKALIRSWNIGFCARVTVWMRAEPSTWVTDGIIRLSGRTCATRSM